jgi:putative membrane protein
MLFIDYVPLLLINMATGLCMLAHFVYAGLDAPDPKRWVPGFATVGIIATLAGLHMSWTWPLPGSYNVAFGELSVFLGILFLGAALALDKGWDLTVVTIYAFFAGLAAIVLGIRIGQLGLTKTPQLTAVGFLLSGAGGVFALPVLYLKQNRALRVTGALMLIAAAAIWAVIAYVAYWNHMSDYAKWVPATMR